MATPVIEKEGKTVESVNREGVNWWPPQGEWTYEDYARLPDNGMRYEVIDGDLFMSLPSTTAHQTVVIELVSSLLPFIKEHHLGRLYTAPLDVILRHRATPVQPHIVFILKERLNIIKELYIEGAPDLIIEILSPRTAFYDLRTKFDLYAWAGVKEYWLVDSEAYTADVYTLRGNAYVPFGRFTRDGIIQSELLPDLRISLADICPA